MEKTAKNSFYSGLNREENEKSNFVQQMLQRCCRDIVHIYHLKKNIQERNRKKNEDSKLQKLIEKYEV